MHEGRKREDKKEEKNFKRMEKTRKMICKGK
jgi:hypothetical protein